MSQPTHADWLAANQRALTCELARIRRALARHAGDSAAAFAGGDDEPIPAWPDGMAPSALERLCALFGLSAFEREIVLLCAGVELEAAFAPLCAAAHGDPRRDYPTFGLALAVLPGADWAALAPAVPLRRWQLVQLEPAHALTRAALRLDERVLHYVAGVEHLDERLDGLVRPLHATGELAPSEQAAARELAVALAEQARAGEQPAALLTGPRRSSRQAVAVSACAGLGLGLYALDSGALPPGPAELERLLRLWEREAALAEAALLLEYDAESDPAREAIVTSFVDHAPGVLIVASTERRGRWERALVVHTIGRPAPAERRGLWAAALGPAAAALNGQLDRFAAQFNLEPPAVGAAWAAARGRLAAKPEPPGAEQIAAALWDASREQARPRLDDLAQRIESATSWDDLVLPETQRELLREIALHVRNRALVYEGWGFGTKNGRGLGITALFAGPSGTGKTLAAEVLANELRLDLYRIDLSQVISKYIGETEKNLRRVFDAAEGCGAILLFDEADALFGKRSEVKDSHDRHANVEVSYLLQRMEAYSGLAILTTNLKDALDSAFLRRIRFVVQFPFPDASQRAEIWRHVFPNTAPLAALDAEKLARLNVAGGNIRNIALHAAFLAADAGEPVGMGHLLRAARREYAKIERALTDAETKGWV